MVCRVVVFSGKVICVLSLTDFVAHLKLSVVVKEYGEFSEVSVGAFAVADEIGDVAVFDEA